MSESTAKVKRTEIRWPEVDTVFTINADGSRNFLHPADVKGRFQRLKNIIFTALIAVYIALPWIMIGGYPAVHIDIPGRQAFLFGQTFTNQDFYLMFFLITGIGFSLFVVTSLWGRLWCGYACPQTVFLEGVYRKIERWIEGPRTTRIRRNMGPMTGDKLWRKALKHTLFVVLSFIIAHIFLAYFIPVRELVHVVSSPPSAHWSAFLWSMAWTGAMYFNYSWFREQLCLVICPYGRLQSALTDADSLTVGYDRGRGEPRSKVSESGGDCIDCHRCVVVCPTGIDIRNGLQMECIGCANCIDACDEIMDKLGKPRGLVRYDSKVGLETGRRRRLLRPRLLVYAVLGVVGLTVFTLTAMRREPFEAKVLRARGMPYTLEGERIRNLYNISIQNKGAAATTYTLAPGAAVNADGSAGTNPDLEFLIPQKTLRIEGLADEQTPVFAYYPRASYTGAFPFTFTVTDSITGHSRTVEARFLGP